MNNKKILLGLTTTPRSDWREKTREIDRLGLKEVALFPTFIPLSQRRKLYHLLEKTKLEKIPHVHLRDDMEEWEIAYFFNHWKTEVFNIHPNERFLSLANNRKWQSRIFVENHSRIDKTFRKMLALCGGVCLDYAHWKIRQKGILNGYLDLKNIVQKNLIGCCHVSAVRKKWGFFWKDDHWYEELSDFDYLKLFVEYLPSLISLELENSFEEQLKAKKYLKDIILKGLVC